MSNLNNKGLKAVIVILSLLLVSSLAYIFKLSNQVDLSSVKTVNLITEKDKVIANLNALKEIYDQAIAENTTISADLIAEREKVVQLLNDVSKSNGSIEALSKYKTRYVGLEGKMQTMMVQVADLTKKNTTLSTQIDSTKTVINSQNETNAALKGQNSEMNSKIESASRLTILNVKGTALTIKSSGKQLETEKASKTDAIKITFTIPENKLAKVGDRDFYVQVIDAGNNVLGEKKSITFDGKLLYYSYLATIKFDNNTIENSQTINGKDFMKGNYKINIFDKNNIIISSNFNLK
jgi:hypothetical protein